MRSHLEPLGYDDATRTRTHNAHLLYEGAFFRAFALASLAPRGGKEDDPCARSLSVC